MFGVWGPGETLKKKKKISWEWWLKLIILATWEAEDGRIAV
jgi:hypothetical protein